MRDSDFFQQFMCNRDTCFNWLAFFKDDLQFKEIPQPFHFIQMNACSSRHEYDAVFVNMTAFAIGECQHFTERIG